MKNKNECVELQSRMVEYFAGPPERVPEAIEQHLADCEECRLEFSQLNQVLGGIKESADKYEQVPEHLFDAVEARLDATEQLRPAVNRLPRLRNQLILQYSYLATMAVIIWLTLLLAQPVLTGWLIENDMMSSFVILDDYGVFIAFFITGGIFAMICAPLLIKTAMRRSDSGKKFNFLRWLFSAGLRTFAC
jgi:hypothetical protein